MKGLSQQRGISFMGGLFVLILLAFIGLAALHISPVYLDSMAVKQIMDSAIEEVDGQYSGRRKVQDLIGRQLSMNDIDYLKPEDFVLEQSRDGGLVLSLEHRESRRLFGNIYLTVAYDHRSE